MQHRNSKVENQPEGDANYRNLGTVGEPQLDGCNPKQAQGDQCKWYHISVPCNRSPHVRNSGSPVLRSSTAEGGWDSRPSPLIAEIPNTSGAGARLYGVPRCLRPLVVPYRLLLSLIHDRHKANFRFAGL